MYTYELCGFTKVTTFVFIHKFLLQLIEEQRTFSTHKANIIDIDNSYN